MSDAIGIAFSDPNIIGTGFISSLSEQGVLMNNQITETIMKSSMNVKDEYDRKIFLMPCEELVWINIREENDESISVDYDISELTSFETIKELTVADRYRLLLGIFHVVKSLKDYEYSLEPSNLYYDMNDRIKVLRRDIKKESTSNYAVFDDERGSISEICSLIIYSLQDKYSYNDILEGGIDLINDEDEFKELLECGSLDELKAVIKNRYEEMSIVEKNLYMTINRKWYMALRIFFVAGSTVIIILLILLLIYKLYREPFLKAMVRGEEFYISGNYPETIEAMKNVSVKRMDINQKYILAVSYIKMESLTDKQKENIIADIPRNSDELLMEYWIYIGRKEAAAAENAAMQEADDELLLYAYMLEYENIQINKRMSGEIKASKMEELTTKINELAKPYLDAKEQEESDAEKEQEEKEKSIVETRLDTLEEQIKEQQKQIEENRVKQSIENTEPEE